MLPVITSNFLDQKPWPVKFNYKNGEDQFHSEVSMHHQE